MRKILFLLFIFAGIMISFLSQGQGNGLPACDDLELDLLNNTIVSEYNGLMTMAFAIETTDDLVVYIESQINWRDNTLSQLPDCAEAIEQGMLMQQISSDVSTFYALDFAGVSPADNPIESSMTEGMIRFNELTEGESSSTLQPTATTKAVITKTYYVASEGSVNIRSCGSTNCGVVATANRGDVLTVVDDSDDWYELQLDNGVTGYIAEFLVSVNPPSTRPTSAPVQPTAIPQNNTQPIVQPTAIPVQPTAVPPPSDSQICGGASTCGAMASCEQAYACLRAGNGRLDRDNDGVPCESICPGG